jgi:hypothetical protein
MKKENLDKLVQETLSSLDGATRAVPAPFLLTRINARMGNAQEATSIWERAGVMLTRPRVAFSVLVAVVLMNFLIITSADDQGNASSQTTQVNTDEYSLNTASSLYDFENAQP